MQLEFIEKKLKTPKYDKENLKSKAEEMIKERLGWYGSCSSSTPRMPAIMETLYEAAISDSVDVIKATLENPTLPPRSMKFILDYAFEGECKGYLLHIAAAKGSVETVRYLVKLDGINFTDVNADGYNPLHLLIISNKVKGEALDKIVSDMLNKCPDLLDTVDYQGNNLMNLAAFANAASLCRILVEKFGMDATFKDPLWTAAQYACKEAFKEILSMDPSLEWAHGGDNTCLHFAVKNRWFELLDELVNRKWEMLEMKNCDGDTPLMLAVKEDLLDACEILIKHVYEDNDVWTDVLDAAAEFGTERIRQWVDKAFIN